MSYRVKKQLQESGITLVALVVTIIVLLILAGVTLGLVLNNNGIIGRASSAVDAWKRASLDEQALLEDMNDSIDPFLEASIPTINGEIDGLPAKKTAEQLPDYIPIYTIEQMKKIASNETNYEIRDLNGSLKKTVTMASNEKYALMVDFNFNNVNDMKPIRGFTGELEGNGCTISNLNMDTSEEERDYTNVDGRTPDAHPAAFIESLVNGTVRNLAITNSTMKSSESVAGIVGQGNDCTIENCYVKDSSFIGSGCAKGGIVGYLGQNGGTINNCKVINTNIVNPIAGTGGICGHSSGNISIDGCKFLGGNDNGIAAGIIYTANGDVNITNCQVQDVQPKNFYGSGIIVSSNKRNADVNISGCTVLNAKAVDSSCSCFGGIMNHAEANNITIENCKVENIETQATQNSGIIRVAYGNDVKINNCSAKNIKYLEITQGISDNSGGISEHISATDLEINNCLVDGIEFNGTATGGIVNNISGTDASIKNCVVRNMLDNKSSTSGGMINNAGIRNLTIDGCKIYGCKVTVNRYGGGIINTLNVSYGSEGTTIKNCVVKNYENENDNTNWIGGIIQYGSGKTNLENCIVENSNIDVAGGDSYAGGIAGCLPDATIKNCKVKNSTIESSSTCSGIVSITGKGTINECDIENTSLKGKTNIGGILAVQSISNGSLTISKCSSKNCTIINISNSVNMNNTGGIAGFIQKGTVEECNTINPNIENTSYGTKTGGILGGTNTGAVISKCKTEGGTIKNGSNVSSIITGGICGFGITIIDSEVNGTTIDGTGSNYVGGIAGQAQNSSGSDKLIRNCRVNNVTIKGVDDLGGICGATCPNISECNVANSHILGTGNNIGGIQGFAGEIRGNNFEKVVIDKCEVSGTEITGNSNVNHIQGKNSYYYENPSAASPDEITNCKYNGANATQ